MKSLWKIWQSIIHLFDATMGKKNKNIKHKNPPQSAKRVGQARAWHDSPFKWQLSRFDFYHEEWGLKAIKDCDVDELKGVLETLKSFETMKWSEICAPRNRERYHYLEKAIFYSKAKKRLQSNYEDVGTDSLFSMRLDARKRLIGIPEKGIFQVIWYDPDHSVYRSEKKHT